MKRRRPYRELVAEIDRLTAKVASLVEQVDTHEYNARRAIAARATAQLQLESVTAGRRATRAEAVRLREENARLLEHNRALERRLAEVTAANHGHDFLIGSESEAVL